MEPALQGHPLTPGAAPGPGAAARAAARRGLYVHVPFCASRCTYCDFASGTRSGPAVARYLAALEREAGLRAPAAAGAGFGTVFLGGGTPSLLAPRAFRQLWRTLCDHFALEPGAEITLEANPESVGPERLVAWAAAGVNRLSLGAQSFVPEELATLGRRHAPGRPAEAFALARAHGFRRLSLDLIFGFPGNTRARLAASLEAALALGPEHLSVYCFIPEPGTALGDAVALGLAPLPAPAEQADAYRMLTARLASAGFACYETSNFCRPGAEARHNLVYWLRREYLGLGPSAHGFWGGERYGNHAALADWAAALEQGLLPEGGRERETPESAADEIVMLGLRLGDGLEPGDYPPAAWRAVEQRYAGALAAAVAAGRLEATTRGWRVPPRFRFVADEAIAWIEARAQAARVDSPTERSVTSRACRNPRFPAA